MAKGWAGNIEVRLWLARAAAKARDRAAAVQKYRRILQMVPDQPEARRELDGLAGWRAFSPGGEALSRESQRSPCACEHYARTRSSSNSLVPNQRLT